jgi:hypothetical protein
MSDLDRILQEFDEGLYTLGETHWRLLKVSHGAAEIDNLIARLPGDFAAAWIEWARASFSGSDEGRVFLGSGSRTPNEQQSIDAMRGWLATHRERKGED